MRILKYLTLIAASSLLCACNAPVYQKTVTAIKDNQHQIRKIEAQNQLTAPPVVVRQGYYVNAQPVQDQVQPKWMQQAVDVQADNLPFTIMLNRLLGNTNINVSFNNNINKNRLVSMHYDGPIQGALKILANKTDYYYQVSQQTINWSALETRTFNISFMPGSSKYLVGQTENGNQDQQNQSNGGQEGYQNVLDDEQYSNLEGTLSVWNDLRDTLDRLKSPKGQVVVSESTSSVTIQDHPNNVRSMAHYIKRLNKLLSKEVAIKVQVLNIELNKDFNFGINWDAVIHTLDTRLNFVANWAGAANLAANDIINSSKNSAMTSLIIGKGDHQTLINALSKQGKLSVVTKPEVVTMNDQVAAIRITRDTGYIRSVSSTSGTFGNNVSTTITPGTITDGFTLYVLPKIVKNRVYMQISSTLSNLVQLVKQSASSGSSRGGQLNAIELPTVAQKSFNQRSVVSSGATLVIAGYKSLHSEIANAGLPGINKLGLGAQQKNIETLVLITPIILKTHSGN